MYVRTYVYKYISYGNAQFAISFYETIIIVLTGSFLLVKSNNTSHLKFILINVVQFKFMIHKMVLR